jgi:hypothetical protein
MNREEMIKTIRDLVGGKMVFDTGGVITLGDDRPVWQVTKKYVYMAVKCYVKDVWEEDTLVSVIRKIPVCGTLYGELTHKILLDSLCTRDLERLYDGVIKHCEYQISRIAELQQQLDACNKVRSKYNKVLGKKL